MLTSLKGNPSITAIQFVCQPFQSSDSMVLSSYACFSLALDASSVSSWHHFSEWAWELAWLLLELGLQVYQFDTEPVHHLLDSSSWFHLQVRLASASWHTGEWVYTIKSSIRPFNCSNWFRTDEICSHFSLHFSEHLGQIIIPLSSPHSPLSIPLLPKLWFEVLSSCDFDWRDPVQRQSRGRRRAQETTRGVFWVATRLNPGQILFVAWSGT